MAVLPIVLGTSMDSHVRAIAAYAHEHMDVQKRANVLLMGDINTVQWHEAFPLDLLFVYSNNKATPEASVITSAADEPLPIADDSMDAVVIQFDGGRTDAVKEAFRILAPGGTLVVFDYINREIGKDARSWHGFKISGIPALTETLPEGAVLREFTVVRASLLNAFEGVINDPDLSKVGCVLISITK